ncbi:MAG: ATP-dependent RecD-like DNA helicase [Candidatus Improbicoccus devescovinae]|nr:MAG: ATP-dependent RecD-like DNA helicase [Candidatus Improbicoccus devescovinae]
MAEKLRGVIERVTYSDENNGFRVLKMRCKGFSEFVTIVGNIAHISVGTVMLADGKWSSNQKFGRQFEVLNFEEVLPANIFGIEKYLGSGLIKGIGPKYAKLIVNRFGTKTLAIIENSPEKLAEISKFGKKRIDSVKKAWDNQKDIKNLMIFLQEAGVSTALGHRIYKVWGKESVEKIKENPYALADRIDRIGFITADIIARKLGVDKESHNRCRAGIFYVLNYLADKEGHCFVPSDKLVKKCSEMLEIKDTKIIISCDDMLKNKELFLEGDKKIYLPAFFFSEIGLTRRIKKILYQKNEEKLSDTDFENQLENLQNKNDIKYDEFQIEAIKTAANSKFSIITGGAGVGKTTITKAIIEIFKKQNKKILLAAPTGRAAKKMSETCGFESKTIHRLLGHSPNGGFEKNEENKLNGNILIVDETSMIDLILMYNLMKAVPDEMNVILIGDINQLPSIGAGNVLKDIIESKIIPVIKLTKIYRQSLKSNIIMNSHKINNGEMPDLKSAFDSDFFFIENNNADEITKSVSDLCARRLPNYYKVNPISDIQVLTPIRKTQLGADNLNKILQAKLNKNTFCLRHGTNEFRLGDKVMQVKNNYRKDIFNGDIGIVSEINLNDNFLKVNFDETHISYDISELEELTLAYTCTIHKSQGGQYPIIVILLPFNPKILERNLLYTAVTRSEKICILIGERRAVKYAVQNNSAYKRYTLLEERLRKLNN